MFSPIFPVGTTLRRISPYSNTKWKTLLTEKAESWRRSSLLALNHVNNWCRPRTPFIRGGMRLSKMILHDPHPCQIISISGMRDTCDMMAITPVMRLLGSADFKKACLSSVGLIQSHEPFKSAWRHQVRDSKHEREILCHWLQRWRGPPERECRLPLKAESSQKGKKNLSPVSARN